MQQQTPITAPNTVIEQESNAGHLGDAMHTLALNLHQTQKYKDAQVAISKAIGLRRLYFGKKHEKLQESLELAKLIQVELSKTERRRTRRKTVRPVE